MNDTIVIDSDTIPTTCLICNKTFGAKSAKAKYCSEACKQQAKRIRELEKNRITFPKTDVDKVFDTHKPGYYYFSDTIRTVKCIVCNKEFKTSLNLLKTCSVAHRDEVLANLTGHRVQSNYDSPF